VFTIHATHPNPSLRNATTKPLDFGHAASSTRSPSCSSNQANTPVHAPQVLAACLVTITNATLANTNFTNANLATATINTFALAVHTDASD
jgi:hypothetical protein